MTKKLEDQSLEEEQNYGQKECPVEDSGTESDDETEGEEVEDDEAGDSGGDCNLDSGVSLNLRSSVSGPGGRHSRQLPSLARKVEPIEKVDTVVNCNINLPQHNTGGLMTELDNDQDHHSSEEELEDIIGTGAKKVYRQQVETNSIKSGHQGVTTRQGLCASTNPEKRKWSEVNRSSTDEEGGHHMGASAIFRAGSGSSGDEEVSGLMDGAGGGSYTPVQFCTSPPLDVYKPRKSQSPPPKLFHMSHMNGHSASSSDPNNPPRQNSLDMGQTSREGQRPSGAFRQARPRVVRPLGGPGVVEYSSLPSRVEQDSPDSLDMMTVMEGDEDGGHRSPNKRHRSTPKPQNIQRPCLDFEKMQQIKTRVVTSWRQGTELSLFCW